jgi:hypothetical protein
MKTVIIGSDFVYDSSGVIKPVEMNTNIAYSVNKVETEEEVFDSTDLKLFINTNGFTKITYIGQNHQIKTFLKDICQEIEIEFVEIFVGSTAITVPNIEDSNEHLIIRTAYDVTAILDEEYCKDKVNFLNLIKDTAFGSQFAYMDETNQLVNNITEIKDNGTHPNFILKAKHPSYDKNVYPKLYKVSNQEELDVVLQNVDNNHFLMEFHINSGKLVDGNVTKVRKISLLHPPILESIHIGTYTDLTLERLPDSIEYDDQTFELSSNQRNAYITKDAGTINLPKLMDDDFVVMADDTLKSGLDLQIGDVVKTIDIPNIEGAEIEDEVSKNYNIDFNTFASGVTYNTNIVTDKKRVDAYVMMCLIEFDDNTTWSDTINSMYLVLNDGLVKFKRLDTLSAGDVILLVNTSNTDEVTVEQKTIANITAGPTKFSGWVITVERTHLFLTKTSGSIVNSPSFAAIEHNFCAVICDKNQCMHPSGWSMSSCIY